MSIVSSIMVPHPPLIIPEIGKGRENEIINTINAYNKACKLVSDSKPDTIVIISPHTTYYRDYFHILDNSENYGDLSQFSAPDVKFNLDYDNDFIEKMSDLYKDCGRLGRNDNTLDHGTIIPLYFLNKYVKEVKYIVIGLSNLPLKDHYRLGMIIKEVSNTLNRKVSIIASGDLSHKLLESGPYGYNEKGPIYDNNIMNTMKNASFNELFEYDNTLLSEVAECGHRSFTIMSGAFDKENVISEELSYEGPFGVGYGVCTYISNGINNERNFLDKYLAKEKEEIQKIRQNESEIVSLARKTVELFVNKGHILQHNNDLSDNLLKDKKGVFVTLHKYSDLRGCIGTIYPTKSSIAEEVINNAISACSKDARFEQVTPEELDFITYSVDTLGEIEKIESKDCLDINKYGVIVRSGPKTGLLLPNIDGISSVDEQIEIAMKKGNILPGEDIYLSRFEVNRYY